ncbi:MAG TPA: hypothetical protein VF188_05235 [Longimicrobiales bacterium]
MDRFPNSALGDTWIIDMRHYLGVDDAGANAPAAARRLAEYFGSIVRAATAAPSGVPADTEIRCRRRPGRRPCQGRIRIYRSDVPAEIRWGCTHCNDNGYIRGWKGTPWDAARTRRHARRHPR